MAWLEYLYKTITLFLNCEKGKEEVCQDFLEVKNKLVNTTIADEIENAGVYRAKEFFPFKTGNAITYSNLDNMLNQITEETKIKGKKFIYAYDDEPDHTMHDYGADSEIVKNLIKERNKKVENFCNNLTNSLVIIIADHGHIKVDNIFLKTFKLIPK